MQKSRFSSHRKHPGMPRHLKPFFTHFHTRRMKDNAKIQNSIQTHKPGTEKRLLYLIYIKKHAIDTQRQIYPPKSKIDRTISLLCLFCVVFRKCRKHFCKLVSRRGMTSSSSLRLGIAQTSLAFTCLLATFIWLMF